MQSCRVKRSCLGREFESRTGLKYFSIFTMHLIYLTLHINSRYRSVSVSDPM